ncbi:Ig-like domain-containing protein [Citricoccus nitrophenolicus]|uniref:HYR domain-containing protein n=1 Tax=Citricoccus muralis TaxID=169134 RepID=A0A3D9LFF0_9MICC|nr:Ig-like domain-containing protein [Citricoccus muralis]REE04137.1 hypothetical protein C8E99_1964 [Citricoccus muralis]
MATTAGTLLVLAGLVGTAQATPMPSSSDSPGPTQSAAPAPSPPGSSPSPSSGGNQPPEIDCPGLVTQTGDTESVRIHAIDPDGDTITLSAGTSWLGGSASVEGHVVTYTAPTDTPGNDWITVTADDGRGGTSECEISILVQSGPSPTPTPTPTSPSPTPDPTTSAPEPSPEPTGGSGTPTQAPTSAPTAGPTQNPTTPGGSAPATGAPTAAPGTGPGNDGNGGGGTGGEGSGPSGSAPGNAGGNGSAGNGSQGNSSGDSGPGSSGGSDGQTPASTGSPSAPAAETPSAQKLSNIIRDTAIACPVQAVADAEKLIAGISAGMTSRPGSGNFASGDASGGTGRAEPVAAAERTAHTGSTPWLFAGVGFMMIALIALALAALPRGDRRH